MADNLITAATYDQIATMLSKLATNYSNLASVFYDVFYNTTPEDVTFQMYDESGVLQTYTIPNRAKDLQNLLSGEGAPENTVDGSKGTLYQDLLNGDLYIKETPEGNDGWTQFATKDFLKNVFIQGNGDPNEVGVVAPVGTLYIQIDAGSLWIKTTITGGDGWERISVSYGTFADTSLSNLTEAGNNFFANPKLDNLFVPSPSEQNLDIGVNRFANRSLDNLSETGYNLLASKENVSNKINTITPSTTSYPSSSAVYNALLTKQDKLTSGVNIKTVGGSSLLGSGDALPSQSGQSGKYLTTNGSSMSWSTVNLNSRANVDLSNLTYSGLNKFANTSLSNLSTGLANVICTTRPSTTSTASDENPAVVVENYVNGNSWYRIYSDGWCEQGGFDIGNVSTTTRSYTLLKTYNSNGYNIQVSQAQRSSGNCYNLFILNSDTTANSFKVYSPNIGNINDGVYWKTSGYLANGQY